MGVELLDADVGGVMTFDTEVLGCPVARLDDTTQYTALDIEVNRLAGQSRQRLPVGHP